jgi:hypothetical protein
MPEPDLFRIFVSRLNLLNVRYMITGAVAGIVYGEPRLTHDVDLVIELHPDDTEKFCETFSLEEFYCPPPEIIRIEVSRRHRGHFNLIHHETGFKADIYTAGADELHAWAFQNRRLIDVSGEKFWFAPVEYVIIRKLEYYREGGSEKHLRDIAGILTVSSEQIKFDALQMLIRKRLLDGEWEKVKDYNL